MLKLQSWKTVLILVIALGTSLLALPNVLPEGLYNALPKAFQKTIPLGLDLRGGSHLLFQLDVDEVRRERMENLRDEVRRSLRDAKLQHQGINFQGNGVVFRLREGQDSELALTEMRKLRQPIGGVLNTSGQYDIDVTRSDDGLFTLSLTEAGVRVRVQRAMDQSIEVIRRRIDQLGTVEPSIQRQGIDRILVQAPGLKDPKELIDVIGSTAKLTFRLVDQTMRVEEVLQGRVAADSEVLYEGEGANRIPYLIQKRVIVSGDDLVDAQATFDQQSHEPVVSFRFNSSGGRKFGQATQENIGRPFAIVLDNKVISAPVIRDAILAGSGQISGRFTVEAANRLALLLRAGALPAKLTVVEERSVGPGLGSDSIKAGTHATIIGSIFVLLFMLATYGLFGMIANIAVIVHVIMMFGLMTLVGITLTLPGIAGIVLTVGMAVDANVLIYERIREEARTGRSLIASIDAGFTKAIATIWDANITQLLAALILFFLGTGPVRGFSVTLALGILTTVFTSVTFTRLLVVVWLRWFKPTRIPL